MNVNEWLTHTHRKEVKKRLFFFDVVKTVKESIKEKTRRTRRIRRGVLKKKTKI